MKKLNKTQKQLLKKSILKAVNITCYVITGLSIALFTAIGLKSCSDKKSKDYTVATTPVINETLNEKRQINGSNAFYYNVAQYDRYFNGRTFYFNPNNVSNDYINNEYWDEFLLSTNFSNGLARVKYPTTLTNTTWEYHETTIKSLSFDGYTRLYNSNSAYDGLYFPRLFVTPLSGSSFVIDVAREWDIDYYSGLSFDNFIDDFRIEFLRRDGYEFYNTSYTNDFRNNSIIDTYDLIVSGGFTASNNYVDMGGYNYQFNSVITPMAYMPMSTQATSKLVNLGGQTIIDTFFGFYSNGVADSRYFMNRIFDGSFYCNGVNYSTIDIVYILGLESSDNYYLVPAYLKYDNVIVAKNIALDNGGNGLDTDIGTTQWLSPVYQNIVIYGYYDVYNGTLLKYQTSDTLNILDLLTSASLVPLPDNPENALTGVFGLLAQAFKSASSFFSVQIFPNITIGTLFFVPFVISLVFTIVWLFKR